jgi:hypothetical protein
MQNQNQRIAGSGWFQTPLKNLRLSKRTGGYNSSSYFDTSKILRTRVIYENWGYGLRES